MASQGNNSWLAAGIQSAGGVFGSMIAARANKKAWERQVQTEQAIWERDTKYQEQYNSPQAQMERFKAAGLNPNLIYGQGTPGNVSVTGTVPRAESYLKGAEPFIQMTANAFSEGLLFAAELRKKNAEADLINVRREGAELTNEQLSQRIVAFDAQFPELMRKLRRDNEIGEVTKDWQIIGARSANQKLYQDVKMNLQRMGILSLDDQIRTEVLESKRVQNELLQLQRDFLKEGDVSNGQLLRILLSFLGGRGSAGM